MWALILDRIGTIFLGRTEYVFWGIVLCIACIFGFPTKVSQLDDAIIWFLRIVTTHAAWKPY